MNRFFPRQPLPVIQLFTLVLVLIALRSNLHGRLDVHVVSRPQ